MNYSQITDHLFIGTTPRSEAYHDLRRLGVKLVINMRIERRPYPDQHSEPIPALWLPSFDSPFIPIPQRYLRMGVKAALETIRSGGKVYVHCAQGVHRGPAMAAAILIAQGHSPEAALRLIKQRRPHADPEIEYVKRVILKFAKDWKSKE